MASSAGRERWTGIGTALSLLTAVVFLISVLLPTVAAGSSAFPDHAEATGDEVRRVGAAYQYRNYTEIKRILFDIESRHPDIARVYDVGNSWEKNHRLADRDILAVKISDNVLEDEGEPEALIVGLHHAREWTTSELVTELVSNLTSGYGNDSRISWLVDNREIWLVPIVNPDGLDYALSSDQWWRKNRRLNYDGSYGVDLNRNYEGSMNGDPAGAWGGVGSSHNPSDETYCGEAPFSEPETQAIRGLVLRHDFRIALDFHSYSELVMWPWGYMTNLTPDNGDMVRIGTKMAALNGYTPMQSVGLYPTTGASIDWHYGGFDIFAFCFEIGKEFHPSDAGSVRSIISANLPAALLGIEIAGDRYERRFEIDHDAPSARNYSAYGFGVRANITADRGVNTSSLRVLYRVSGEAWVELPISRTAANDTYEALIPPAPVGSLVEYYIAASDCSGVELQSPRYAPYDLHCFVVTPAVRDYPPAINHIPRGQRASVDTAFVSEGIEIRASVIDDHNIRGVCLNYRAKDSSEPFIAVDMARVAGNFHAAVIPSAYDSGAEYYIEATDDKDHVSRAPAEAPSTWYLSYNTPPVFGPVTVPGSPPGNVSYGCDVEVCIRASDDFGVHEVVMILLDQHRVEHERMSMALRSGTAEDGVWSATLNTGPVPGTISLDFIGSDGRACEKLEGPVIYIRDTAPPHLEHHFNPALPEDAPILSVRASDDIGIVQVRTFFAVGVSQSFEAIAMVLVSGTDADGLYECTLPLGGFEGEVRYYFEAYDGALLSTLPVDAPAGFYLSTVTDPTPLEILFAPPRSVEGSIGFALIAEARNISEDTAMMLHLRDGITGALQELVMAPLGPRTFVLDIHAGQLLGEYVVWLTALAGGEEIQSSPVTTMVVTDETAPRAELQRAQQLDGDRLAVSVSCSDAYGVRSVALHYRLGSEDTVRTTSMSLASGTERDGTWSATVQLNGSREIEYRFIASDSSQSTESPVGWLTLSLGDDGSLHNMSAAVAAVVAVALAAGVLAYPVLNRARRP